MRKIGLTTMTVTKLVERFAAIGIEQDDALLRDEIARFNRLYNEKKAIEEELKTREGDQRRALLKLYKHRNAQVRLNAVNATLAVAPDVARRMLQTIADSHEHPQAGDAGMAIRMLERGIYKPT